MKNNTNTINELIGELEEVAYKNDIYGVRQQFYKIGFKYFNNKILDNKPILLDKAYDCIYEKVNTYIENKIAIKDTGLGHA